MQQFLFLFILFPLLFHGETNSENDEDVAKIVSSFIEGLFESATKANEMQVST